MTAHTAIVCVCWWFALSPVATTVAVLLIKGGRA